MSNPFINMTNLKPSGHVNGLVEYRECCYSCQNITLKSHCGWCRKNSRLVKNVRTCRCNDFKALDLLECEICHMFVRALGSHVRAHKITASKYKEMFGYNRTTGLVCSATKRLLSDTGKQNIPRLNEVNYVKNGGTPPSTKGMKIRTEGKLNIKQSKSNVSEETKRKISESLKGKSIGNTKPKTEEFKRKMSLAQKARLSQRDRHIVRDAKGRIVTYTESYKYWKKLDKHWSYRDTNNND